MFGVLHDRFRGNFRPSAPPWRYPVFSIDSFESPSRDGMGLALLRQITQPA
jgi:hypothetical protein